MSSFQQLRSGFRPRKRLALIVAAVVSAGCSHPATYPDSGEFAANWMGPTGTDSWTELHLHQDGDSIDGAYVMASANFGGMRDSLPLIGTTSGRQATLHWVERNGAEYDITASVVLAHDGQSFSGTWSLNGRPALPFGPYDRVSSP